MEGGDPLGAYKRYSCIDLDTYASRSFSQNSVPSDEGSENRQQSPEHLFDHLNKVKNLNDRLTEIELLYTLRPFHQIVCNLCSAENQKPFSQLSTFDDAMLKCGLLHPDCCRFWRIKWNEASSRISISPKFPWPLSNVLNTNMVTALNRYSSILARLHRIVSIVAEIVMNGTYETKSGISQIYCPDTLHFFSLIRRCCERVESALEHKLAASLEEFRSGILDAKCWEDVNTCSLALDCELKKFFDVTNPYSKCILDANDILFQIAEFVVKRHYEGFDDADDIYNKFYVQRWNLHEACELFAHPANFKIVNCEPLEKELNAAVRDIPCLK